MPIDSEDPVADHYVEVDVSDVGSEAVVAAAPFKIISWDIECMSSHGDFPVPKKDYRKVAREVIEGKISVDEIYEELPTALECKDTKHFSKIYLKHKLINLDKLNKSGVRFAVSNVTHYKEKENKSFNDWSKKYNVLPIKSNYISYHDNSIKIFKEVLVTNY
jgi:hypothetical protein